MTSHLDQNLERDISRIREKAMEMSRLAEGALRKAVRSLVERNRQLAYGVILGDVYIDELEKELDRLCLEFLVRQQPAAGPLRFAYATIKLNTELERIGDYAESIARQVLKVSDLSSSPPVERFIAIAELSIPMFHKAMQAFETQDAGLARSTIAVEEEVDRLRNELDGELLRWESEGTIPLNALTPFMTIARRLERVADQARNICEEVLYMCTGEYVKHRGAELIRILFVDNRNACRSQMAEAIGNALGNSSFLFTGAGIAPTQLDPGTVEFLKGKGIDISANTPRSVQQVPNLDHYQVIVGLSSEAAQVFPAPPTKTVVLDWSIPDPSLLSEGAPDRKAAYQRTYEAISAHLRDLVEAILNNK